MSEATTIESGAPGSVAAAPMRLRITRRGRALVTVLVALVVASLLGLAALFLSPGAQASEVAGNGQDFSYVVAQPGDSLWTLATDLDSEVDTRDLVAELSMLNSLDPSGLQAGQAIAVPLRYADAPGTVSAEEVGA